MNKLLILALMISIQFGSCSYSSKKNITNHIFYIHGRIIEQQGENAFSEVFGKYELDSIIFALRVKESVVYYEIRKENVVPREYAKKISKQIDSLIALGVKAVNITIVGASKGAIIASNVSDLNTNQINYVLLAGNNEYQEFNNNWKFHGQVLCIFDSSDSIAGKRYDYWKNKNNYTTKFDQLKLNTNLGHGFIYKPLNSWVEPTKEWILNQRQ